MHMMTVNSPKWRLILPEIAQVGATNLQASPEKWRQQEGKLADARNCNNGTCSKGSLRQFYQLALPATRTSMLIENNLVHTATHSP